MSSGVTLTARRIRGRRSHECAFCGTIIRAGEVYYQISHKKVKGCVGCARTRLKAIDQDNGDLSVCKVPPIESAG